MSSALLNPLRLGLLILPLFALAACSEAKSEAKSGSAETVVERPVRPVFVARIHYVPETAPRTFDAAIKPRIETDQGFRVAGKVVRRLVDVGDRVKAGQVLGLLDDTDLKLQLEQAKAEASAAKISLEQAGSDEERGKQLRASGWTSQAAFDKLRSAAEEARGRDRRAGHAVELATNSVAYSSLTADADGVVTATFIEPGQVVSVGQAAIRIAKRGEKEAVIAAPESLLGLARDGEATLTLWSRPDHPYRAKLRELAPAADAATRTYAARFSLPDADDAVALGMSATLTLRDTHSAPVAKVPLSALFNQGEGPALWTLGDDQSLHLKPVSVARYDSDFAYVMSGVDEGQFVVSLGVQKLDAHDKVRVVGEARPQP